MPPTSKRTAKAPQRDPKTRYWEEHPFLKGEPVKVSAERFKGKRGLQWTYLRHVENLDTGSIWIDVLDKNGTIRSFSLEEVEKIKPKRKYTRRATSN